VEAFRSINQKGASRMARVPASEATRNALKKMFEGREQQFDQSEFVRQAVRLMIEDALKPR
jgi:hypothetical protein